MSWGNRDCEKLMAPKTTIGGCSYASFETCHELCPYFIKEKSLTKTQRRIIVKSGH